MFKILGLVMFASFLNLIRDTVSGIDTLRQSKQHGTKQQNGGKPYIKEVARAHHHFKPEKPDSVTIRRGQDKRPQGLDRPPEIPRINSN